MEPLINLFIRLLPALILICAVLFVLRPKPGPRIWVYIVLFIVFRDAMTPEGLWEFGSEGFFWICITADPVVTAILGVVSGISFIAIYRLDHENHRFVTWIRGKPGFGVLSGIIASLIIVFPLFLVYRSVPMDARGGFVPASFLPALFVFAMLGNLFEEGLFRGYVMGRLETRFSPIQAGIWSGVLFAFCHMFLAVTVTDIGYPLLVFALWEGIVCGIVASRFGVVSSTLAHGGAVFLLASGLF
jgi:uncharacterized protein